MSEASMDHYTSDDYFYIIPASGSFLDTLYKLGKGKSQHPNAAWTVWRYMYG